MFGWIKTKLNDFDKRLEAAVSNPFAKAATPDQLIVAAVLKSFAEDWDDWRKLVEYKGTPGLYLYNHRKELLISSNTEARHHYSRLRWADIPDSRKGKARYWRPGEAPPPGQLVHYAKGEDGIDYYGWTYKAIYLTINDITLSSKDSSKIWEAYEELGKARDTAKKTAEAAKKAMEDNEAKWNLAERLLGMTRNEQGALVPKETLADSNLG